MIIIGYSGHGYVVIDTILENGVSITEYCDSESKKSNPYNLDYLGPESITILKNKEVALGIGNNLIRKKIFLTYDNEVTFKPIIHSSCIRSKTCQIGRGTFIGANTSINALANIGNACIINTGAIVEHECIIGDYSHVAPGAVLAGNVTVGTASFVGANTVVKQGVRVGDNTIIGAGSVIIEDVPDNVTIVGNPGRIIKTNNK